MSREQWGHGYWQGVKDAQMGKVKTQFPLEAEWLICRMCVENDDKDYDKSLYPVRQLISKLHFCGLDEKYAKRVYDYVMYNEPYGSYISGNPRAEWTEDYFVLPFGYNKVSIWKERAQFLLEKMKE